MIILPAQLSHAQAMHRLHTNAVTTTCKDFYTPKQIKAWLKGRSPEGYHEGIKKGEMFVMEEEGEIIGFGHAIPGEVVAVYVDPASHKKGVGTLILNHALEIASKNHKTVKVESTLNAESFYAKHGFHKIKNGVTKRNGEDIPMVVMERLV